MAVSISDVVSYKRLVAAANNDVYYEDLDVAAGTMAELDTSSGAINTADQLNMFEGYQKVFIVNGANLKVADFVNTKITCTALTDNRCPAKGDILKQDNGSGNEAHMVVDFVNTARTNIYGYAYYKGTTEAFVTTVDISSYDNNGSMDPNPIPNGNISAVTAAPHWYDWTVYPDVTIDSVVTSYGTLPNKAYLGCLYRGRAVISGNPEAPFQWYMSRQGNPFDFAYIANDAQSPVKGGNADAGEIGDIVRALIPYKDDFLVFGCADSMWFMAGDPAEGGSLNELDLTVGIFGANSWCFDGSGNLYFWGTNGIYKTTIPGSPECISQVRLPKLVKDEIVDPSTHRITMEFDRIRSGILICITKLSDGSNSNYWYDLKTDGFFPEDYSDECGAYSLLHYGANNYAYKDLLVGCKDGHIRKFNEALKSDNSTADAVGAGSDAIDSYVTLGPLQMAGDPKLKGKITGLIFVSAGGATDGTESDSSDVECRLFTAKSAEEVVEKMAADTAPAFVKTIKAPGRSRGNAIGRKIVGIYAGIKLQNKTAAQTWGFEQLLINAKQSGKYK